MKYLFLIPFFFFPLVAHGFNIVQASSTHALGFDIEDIDPDATTNVIRIYPPGSTSSGNGTMCAQFSFPYGLAWNNADQYFHVRPRLMMPTGVTAATASASANYYLCSLRGVHTVSIFTSTTDTTANASDTIYLEQMPLDHRSIFVIIFLIGALLAILRPLISKLTLR